MMLYFSGSGVQIFSLGMIFMLLTGPITAVLGIFKGRFSSKVNSGDAVDVPQRSRRSVLRYPQETAKRPIRSLMVRWHCRCWRISGARAWCRSLLSRLRHPD